MNRIRVAAAIAALAILVSLPGCSEPDRRVADIAQQVTHEQAEQNQRVAEASRTLTEGSKQLVEADAKSRSELIGLQRDLQKDQSAIARERDKLEVERQVIAGQRVQESKAGAALVGLVLIVVCLSPLVLAGMSLLGLWRSPTPEEESQILVEELTTHLAGERAEPAALPQPNQAIGLPAEEP